MIRARDGRSLVLVTLVAGILITAAVVLATRPHPASQPVGTATETAPSAPPGSPGSSIAPTARATPSRSLSGGEQAFADAFLALADTHNRACTEILLSNPLSEFDLVGSRLIAQVVETRAGLDSLPPTSLTAGLAGDLSDAIADTIALLEAVDPHGPRVDQATAYQAALDQWVAQVQPVAGDIRAALGLPNATTGDLQL